MVRLVEQELYLADVASFECFAGDGSQFGHQVPLFPLGHTHTGDLEVHLEKDQDLKRQQYIRNKTARLEKLGFVI